MKTHFKQIYSQTNLCIHSEKRQTSVNMLSFNSLQLFTLVLIMTSINLCNCMSMVNPYSMANPVNSSFNKEDELIINNDLPIKLNVTSMESKTDRVMVDSMGKPVKTSSVNIEEEEGSIERPASWETARYII